jgi:hypothetical protein
MEQADLSWDGATMSLRIGLFERRYHHLSRGKTGEYPFRTAKPRNGLLSLSGYGWGARSIDVDNWVAKERPEGPSMWGHDRVWLPDEVHENARKMRMGLAQQGYRGPVQAIEGNYELAPGVCP